MVLQGHRVAPRSAGRTINLMTSASKLRDAFAKFDANGNGYLSVEELVSVFTRPVGDARERDPLFTVARIRGALVGDFADDERGAGGSE